MGLTIATKPKANQLSAWTDEVKILGVKYLWVRKAGLMAIYIPPDKVAKAVSALREVESALTFNRLTLRQLEVGIGIGYWVLEANVIQRRVAGPWRTLYNFCSESGIAERVRRGGENDPTMLHCD